MCVWLKPSGLLFTSCLVPHHHCFEGGGGFPRVDYYAGGWGACLWIWQECVEEVVVGGVYGDNIQGTVIFKT